MPIYLKNTSLYDVNTHTFGIRSRRQDLIIMHDVDSCVSLHVLTLQHVRIESCALLVIVMANSALTLNIVAK